MSGCFNRAEFKADQLMQDGWRDAVVDGVTTRVPLMKLVPFRMSMGCEYTHTELGQADRGCDGCARRAG